MTCQCFLFLRLESSSCTKLLLDIQKNINTENGIFLHLALWFYTTKCAGDSTMYKLIVHPVDT